MLDKNIRLVINLGIIVFGFLGNSVSFVIYTNQVFRKQAIGVYFSCLAVFDTSALILFLSETEIFNLERTLVYCKLVFYVDHVIKFITAWILVAATVDRLLTITHPFKFQILKSTSFQLRLLICLIAVALLKNLDVLVVYVSSSSVAALNGTTTQSAVCTREPHLEFGHEVADVMLSLALPSIILLASSIVIITKACIIKKKRSNIAFGKNNKRIRRHRKYLNLAYTVISMNINFLISHLPLAVFQFIQTEIGTFNWTFYIVDLLGFIHNSTPLLVYLACNKSFRFSFFNLFTKTYGQI